MTPPPKAEKKADPTTQGPKIAQSKREKSRKSAARATNAPRKELQNDRSDKSAPVALIIIIGMGLLLINGLLFLQGFFTDLFTR